MTDGSRWQWPQDFRDAEFIRRVLIVMALGALALLLWRLADVLLLAFGSVLVAVMLHASADLLKNHTPIRERWALPVAGLIILAVVLAILVLFGAQMRGQLAEVADRLPTALNGFTRELGLGDVTDRLPQMLESTPGGGLFSRVAGVGAALLGGLGDLLLVIVAGAFIAADPKLYREGLIKLFPPGQHERVRGSLDAAGEALKLWVLAQLVSMTFVGVTLALGLWALGVPSPFALGLIAGVLDFIPFVGPILGAVPILLMASMSEGQAMLWVVLLLVAVQQLEGNVVFPILQGRMVSVPPALALFAIVAGGVLFGWFGLIFGYPLAVVVFVLVKKLYVRETLGEQTPVPGEDDAKAGSSS